MTITNKRCTKIALLTIGTMLLSSCGGGGGSSPSPPPPQQPPPPPPPSAAPVVSAPAAITVSENRSTRLLTVIATDPDGDPLTFAVASSGDSVLFEVSASGVVAALTPFDFERPQDGGRDNTYDVTIEVSDGVNVVSTTVSITVTNMVNDGITKIVGAVGDRFGSSLASSVGLNGAGRPVLGVGTRRLMPINPVTTTASYLLFADAHSTEESATIFADTLSPDHGMAFVADGTLYTNDRYTFLNKVDFGASPDGPYVYLEYPYPLGQTLGYEKAATFLFENDLNTLRDRGSPLNITGVRFFDHDTDRWKVRATMADAVSTYEDLVFMGDLDGDGSRDYRRYFLHNGGVVFVSGETVLNDVSGEYGVGTPPTRSPGRVVILVLEESTQQRLTEGFPVAIGDLNGDGAEEIAFNDIRTIDGEEKDVVLIVSGAAIFADDDGWVELADLAYPDIYVLVLDRRPLLEGAWIRKGGDFDGDGIQDVLIEYSGIQERRNAVVIFGAAIIADDDGVIEAGDFPNELGLEITESSLAGGNEFQLHSIGDISGDGTDDILLSFPYHRDPNPARARSLNNTSIVYIILGELLSTLDENLIFRFGDEDPRVPRIVAENGSTLLWSDGFAAHAARTADVDGDGIPELALSAPFSETWIHSDTFDDAVGAVYVIPSSRIIEAIADGRPLQLDNDF